MGNEIIKNEEAIVVAEEVAKFDFGKILKTGGKIVGIAAGVYVLYWGGKKIFIKIKEKKAEKEQIEAEQAMYAD